MIMQRGDKMNRIVISALFGIALAVVLAFGMPGRASAFANNTNGRLVLVGADITLGPGGIGIDTDKDKAERQRIREQERERAYNQSRMQRDQEKLDRDKAALDRDRFNQDLDRANNPDDYGY